MVELLAASRRGFVLISPHIFPHHGRDSHAKTRGNFCFSLKIFPWLEMAAKKMQVFPFLRACGAYTAAGSILAPLFFRRL